MIESKFFEEDDNILLRSHKMRISLVLVSFGFVCIVNAAPFVEDVEPEGGRPEDVNTLSAYNRNTNVVRYSSGEGRSYGEGEGKKVYYGEGIPFVLNDYWYSILTINHTIYMLYTSIC